MSAVSSPLSLEQVWGLYQQGLKKFLHSKVSNPDDVDDLQQEILIKTHQNLHTLKQRSRVFICLSKPFSVKVKTVSQTTAVAQTAVN